jgi:hypothetical protein
MVHRTVLVRLLIISHPRVGKSPPRRLEGGILEFDVYWYLWKKRPVFIVHWMFTERLLNVYWMFTECSLNVYWMFTECSLNVHWMLTECSLDVPWMFIECSLNVHWMFTECSVNIQVSYYHDAFARLVLIHLHTSRGQSVTLSEHSLNPKSLKPLNPKP